MSAGISVKGYNSGLFQNEIELNGDYATKIRSLRDEIKIFASFRDAYLTAAVVGFKEQATGFDTLTDKVQPASIFTGELNGRLTELKLVYRTIMLLDKTENLTNKEYENRAFRDDAETENIEKLKKNYALFNSYVCGGIDILYEKFNGLDDDKLIDELFEFVSEFIVAAGYGFADELSEYNLDDLEDN